MKLLHHSLLLLLCSCTLQSALAEDWRDKTELLIYSPRYFGPNAFPIPELRSGQVGRRIEAEVRGEYHYYKGDQTKDLFARLLIPFVKGRAGVEISWTILEDYTLSAATRDERFAVERKSPIGYNGDILFGSFFQVLKSDKWADITISATIKTASGGRLCDARFTDAAAYWFDLTAGRDVFRNEAGTASLRLQAMAGFYCWMTNDLVHRQNDAISYGAGLSGNYRDFRFSTDLSGFYGYENNGDRPIIWRNHLSYELKKNILSIRYDHGMKDRLYDSYSLAYIRCF